MEVRPVSKKDARAFVDLHHRHNDPPSSQQVQLVAGLYTDEGLVGVVTAGRPVARLLDDGVTLEVNRTCVEGVRRNANSMLYGAVCRAAKALGYVRVITYTLLDESGSSLRGAGFGVVAEVGSNTWHRPNSGRVRHDVTLFGERNAHHLPKQRWERLL